MQAERESILSPRFQAKTAAVSSGAEDAEALTQASFHLAQGFHDQAATGLEQALEQRPDRRALRLKLCEAYAAAGKTREFDDAVRRLGRTSPDEWRQIADLRRKLTTKSTVAPAPVAKSIAAPIADAMPPSIAPVAPEPPPAVAAGPAEPEAGVGHAVAADGNVARFNLIDFDAEPPADTGPERVPPAAGAAATDDGPPRMRIDLREFDSAQTDSGFEVVSKFEHPQPVHRAEAVVLSDDANGSRLDLARAYADMGDLVSARELLHEVATEGSAAQKLEAEALIQRLQPA